MYKVGKEEIEAINNIIESRKYFRYQGPEQETQTSLCEKEWQEFLNVPYALLNTSGTNSLVIGLASFGIGPGDEIIIPSYTFVATASAVMQVGAIPIIANIDDTLTIDLEDVRKKITSRTKGIIAVHIDGLICNLNGLLQICHEKNILLFEDAAQACGGSYQGKPVGTIGSFGAFSFNMDKVITCGEGGLLVIGDNSQKKTFLRALSIHDTPCQFGQTFKDQLTEIPSFFGLSTRLNEINSSMLRVQMTRLPNIIKSLRDTKADVIDFAKSLGLKVHLGHDKEGDIGSILHISCSDPMTAISKSKNFLDRGIKASPPYLRPAHACWRWFKGMTKDHYYVNGLNPYNLTNHEYIYKKQDYLTTIKLLGEVIRIELNFIENPNGITTLKEVLKEIAP